MTVSYELQAPRWGTSIVNEQVGDYCIRSYFPRPLAVADLLLSARTRADETLLVQGDRRLTFEGHEAAVARVAQHFSENGVKRGDRVLLLGFNSIEWIVSFWALHTLGAVTALGNAWWAHSEVEAVINELRPVLVVADRVVPSGSTMSLSELRSIVDDDTDRLSLIPWSHSEDDPAAILFSSGTTGTSKAVVLSNKSVIANIHNLLVLTDRLPRPEEPDDARRPAVSLMSVPMFHLAGIQVCCTTMVCGGRIVMLDGKFQPEQALRLIQDEQVTSWGAVPTMVQKAANSRDIRSTDVSSLRSIVLGGAPITSELRRVISVTFPSVRSNGGSLYGLTEAGGVLAAGTGTDVAARPQCVGRALPVVELKIVAADPSGAGEIWARTPAAASGYIDSAEPILNSSGWIPTGDIGYLDDEGWLYVTGRSKDVIIRGGENISADHVEAELAAHPDVDEVCVVGLPHPELGETVGAAVVLKTGSSATAEELKDFLRSRLGAFQVPTHWWRRDESLPLNATGKVLRRQIQDEWIKGGSHRQMWS